jgi:hypothetical protein
LVTLPEIENKIEATRRALRSIGYLAEEVPAQEFCDYMTGETFSGDTTALEDVLENEYLMVHELVEINELKKTVQVINKRVIVESSKTAIYDAHLKAMETELDYALHKRDYLWIRVRLGQYKENILDNDPNLPEEIRPRAEALYEKIREVVQTKEAEKSVSI